MNNGWEIVKIEDILLVPSRNGLTKPSAIRGKGVKMIAMGELFAHPIINDIEMDRVPVTDKELQSSNVEVNDLLFARQSLTLEGAGKCSIVKEVNDPTVFESHLIRLRINSNIADPWYVYYYFNSYYGKHSIQNIVNQVAAAGIKGSDLVKLEIPLPSLYEQKRISSILFSYDEKISTNRKICANLEAQAQALFKHWFIDFGPFKDGEFEESELGMIPKGWRVVSLGEVTKQITEKVGNRTDITVLSPINTGELVLSEEYFTKQVFSKDLSKYLIVRPFTFAYNPARINIGSIGLNTLNLVGCVSPVYVVFQCEYDYHYYFDFYKRTAAFKNEVALRAIGGVRQSLGYNDLSLIKTIYPTRDVVSQFNVLYLKLKEVIDKNIAQNKKLISIRDTLLPKLISGELRVNDTETN